MIFCKCIRVYMFVHLCICTSIHIFPKGVGLIFIPLFFHCFTFLVLFLSYTHTRILSLSLSLSLSLYIYIYIHIHVHRCIYTNIYFFRNVLWVLMKVYLL